MTWVAMVRSHIIDKRVTIELSPPRRGINSGESIYCMSESRDAHRKNLLYEKTFV